MKTISITFTRGGVEIGGVTGKLRQFPGQGYVRWRKKKDLEQMIRPLPLPFPTIGYAEGFERSMLHLATLLDAKATIKKSGRWQIIPQDDLLWERNHES